MKNLIMVYWFNNLVCGVGGKIQFISRLNTYPQKKRALFARFLGKDYNLVCTAVVAVGVCGHWKFNIYRDINDE